MITGSVKGKTILGVGPVSRTVVRVTVDLANRLKVPIILIPSRRQVECLQLGGGYIEGIGNTNIFAAYVHALDKGKYITLARDHGGPWQGTNELDLGHEEAMETAMNSYLEDIKAGFDIIHIDPSLKDRDLRFIQKDVYELVGFCESVCERNRKSVIYEVGTEEHSGKTSDIKVFEKFVADMASFTDAIRFVVGNTGTHVKEMQNVGRFDPDQAKRLVDICNRYDVCLKEHNLDYVPVSALEQHPAIGVHASNVAPEFGVEESKELLKQLSQNGMEPEAKRFLEIAHDSRKWVKWMIENEEGEDKEYKAIISGHYVFSHPEIVQIKMKAQERFDLQGALDLAVEKSIMKYLKAFGWVA